MSKEKTIIDSDELKSLRDDRQLLADSVTKLTQSKGFTVHRRYANGNMVEHYIYGEKYTENYCKNLETSAEIMRREGEMMTHDYANMTRKVQEEMLHSHTFSKKLKIWKVVSLLFFITTLILCYVQNT
jgi:hypothetical protein